MVGRMNDADPVPVADFNRAAAADAAGLLRPACASSRWARRLIDGRPYPSAAAVIAASDAAIGALSWPDIEEALAAHPRIGNRAPSGVGDGRGDREAPQTPEAAWSRQEQAAAAAAGEDVQAALRAGNLAYETRFGHIFLICATGQSAPDMLAALRRRLGNEPGAEREIVRDELRRIVRLRLARTLR
jgi:2-oxo-4-hydroxy-4-carboxy-5-ureidoimidazoline decarboxylase